MVQAPLIEGVGQGSDDMLLARHLREVPGAVLSRQHYVAHLGILGSGPAGAEEVWPQSGNVP